MSHSFPSAHTLSRRTLLKQTAFSVVGLSLLGATKATAAVAAETGDDIVIPPELASLNRFGRMVQEFYVARLRDVEHRGNQRRAELRTRQDAETYIRDVRQKIQSSFGTLPPKTPLNARVTGVLQRDGYRVEKVILESRPGFPVTANLYVPNHRTGRMPAVLGTCGHLDNGKAGTAYQSFCQGLVRQGYVVLIFDPIGQGERLQSVDAALKARHGVGVSEHLHVGAQMSLVGEFLGTWFTVDGVRALDYLLSRPEVDPKHVGLTGNSGGGTQATWLCGIEPRFTMAAPSCFVTTFRRNLENELPADTEQCPPGALALGLDHADYIAVMAPKPVIILGQEQDFFDARGLEESYERLRHLYRLLGAEKNIGLFVGPDYHGYSQANRQEMYRWFNRVTHIESPDQEPKVTLEKDEDLWCTPRGQVGDSQPATVRSLTTAAARAQLSERGQPTAAKLPAIIKTALALPAWDGPAPDYRILRPSGDRRYPKRFAGTYAVETEPGIHALVYRLSDQELVSRPPQSGARAMLYIAHQSADAELRDDAWLADLIEAEPSLPLFACDLRGLGESQPTTTDTTPLNPYGPDYLYAAHGTMLNYPYPSQRTFDAMRVIAWLKSCGHQEIHLVAKGWGTIPGTFAAILSNAVREVTLKNALRSYAEIVEADDYHWPFSAMLPGVLKSFDLPDCYRALESKNLRQLDPWDAEAKPV